MIVDNSGLFIVVQIDNNTINYNLNAFKSINPNNACNELLSQQSIDLLGNPLCYWREIDEFIIYPGYNASFLLQDALLFSNLLENIETNVIFPSQSDIYRAIPIIQGPTTVELTTVTYIRAFDFESIECNVSVTDIEQLHNPITLTPNLLS